MSLPPRITKLLRVVAIVAVVVMFAYFVRGLDWHQLGHALAHAKVWPLLVSSSIYFVCLFGKALSWRILLEPKYPVPMVRLYRYTIAAFAASALTPARAGELLRVWALKTRDGVPVAESTAVALAEKLLDVITLLLVCAPLPWLLPHLPEWVTDAMLVSGSIALGVFIAMFFAVGRVEAREPRSWFGRFIAGLHAVRDPKQVVLALLVLVIVWCLDLIAVSLVLYAVGVQSSVGGAMLILFSFNLAIAIPSTPGQVGALQVGALAATQVLRIPEEAGLAFGLLYQAMQIVPLIILGFILELDLVRGRMNAGNRFVIPHSPREGVPQLRIYRLAGLGLVIAAVLAW